MWWTAPGITPHKDEPFIIGFNTTDFDKMRVLVWFSRPRLPEIYDWYQSKGYGHSYYRHKAHHFNKAQVSTHVKGETHRIARWRPIWSVRPHGRRLSFLPPKAIASGASTGPLDGTRRSLVRCIDRTRSPRRNG